MGVEKEQLGADWEDVLSALIIRGRSTPPLSTHFQIDQYKVDGCLSRVWIVPDVKDGLMYFMAGSDALMTAGIADFICTYFSGKSPSDVVATVFPPLDVLPVARQNGVLAMVNKIKSYAMLVATR